MQLFETFKEKYADFKSVGERFDEEISKLQVEQRALEQRDIELGQMIEDAYAQLDPTFSMEEEREDVKKQIKRLDERVRLMQKGKLLRLKQFLPNTGELLTEELGTIKSEYAAKMVEVQKQRAELLKKIAELGEIDKKHQSTYAQYLTMHKDADSDANYSTSGGTLLPPNVDSSLYGSEQTALTVNRQLVTTALSSGIPSWASELIQPVKRGTK